MTLKTGVKIEQIILCLHLSYDYFLCNKMQALFISKLLDYSISCLSGWANATWAIVWSLPLLMLPNLLEQVKCLRGNAINLSLLV